jgi:NAD-dependent deacetylase
MMNGIVRRDAAIVVLTGAGISAESGLATFRGAGGLWEGHRVDEVATAEAFARDPALVHRFYNERRHQLRSPEVRPNAAHLALAELERRWPGQFLLVTQNVDDLHDRAGSRRLVHMHGELMKARCIACGHVGACDHDLDVVASCTVCGTMGQMRPDIVWFGEMPVGLGQIYDALRSCEVFLSIGTSGQVYPAAGFVDMARATGAHTIELNAEPSAVTELFAEHRRGPAGTIVPRLVAEFLAGIERA